MTLPFDQAAERYFTPPEKEVKKMTDFNLGEVVKLSPAYGGGRLTEKQKVWRWKVEGFDDGEDLDGNPILSCRRLDTKTHCLEHWTTKWLQKV